MTTELHGHDAPAAHAADDAHGQGDASHGHAPEDPNAAPMHHDIDERFSSALMGAAAFLGILALVLGTVLGIVLAND